MPCRLPHAPPGRPLLLVERVEVGVDGAQERLHDVVAECEVEVLALGRQHLLALGAEVVHHVHVGHHHVQLVEVADRGFVVRAREHGDHDVLVLAHQDLGEVVDVRVTASVGGRPVRGDDDHGRLLPDVHVLLPEDALQGVSEWCVPTWRRAEVLLNLLVAGDVVDIRPVEEVEVDAVAVEDRGDLRDNADRLLQLVPATADRRVGVLARVHDTAHRARVVDDHVDVVVVEGAEEGEPVGADLKQSSDVGQALAVELLNVERRGRWLGCR